jgi:hypothetical protein
VMITGAIFAILAALFMAILSDFLVGDSIGSVLGWAVTVFRPSMAKLFSSLRSKVSGSAS